MLSIFANIPKIFAKYHEWHDFRQQEDTRRRKAELARRQIEWAKLGDATHKHTVEMLTESPRFDAHDPAMIKYLEAHGYAVVKDALTKDEVAQAKDLLWQFLEKESSMLRDNPVQLSSFLFCLCKA